ncbi:MAG TPA: DUF3365 domain-containing protein [Verrucomicrobiae bacterium]|nr:DUF3365 domain-containing protein [Verrucomicrobiae bacterium]
MKSASTQWNSATSILRFAGLVLCCSALAACGPKQDRAPNKPAASSVTFQPREMADALHAVVAADREVYARLVVQRLHDEKTLEAAPDWHEANALPLPSQMLRLGSEVVQQQGAEFHYVLRSLWAINPKGVPETDTERAGLRSVLEHPDRNFYAEESLGGRRYLTAVYPDMAVVPACADCHNRQARSPKRDFKQGDVMGGLIVRVPLQF